ncbi:MAG TPA: hypothetical protein VM658_13060 [bacterium]|nr:hypothetical protein [bacterium]
MSEQQQSELKQDLFDLARSNTARLDEEYGRESAALAPDDRRIMDRFAATVRKSGRIAHNMGQLDLLQFLKSGQLKNCYEIAEEQSKAAGGPGKNSIKKKYGTLYHRHEVFHGAFIDGELFLYGSLNIGGLGAARFGDHCSILNEELFQGAYQIAFLQSDSLKTKHYWAPGPTLQIEALARELAPETHKNKLAALKHREEIIGASDPRSWPEILCRENVNIEAIFVGVVTPGELETVRFPASKYLRYAVDGRRAALSKLEQDMAGRLESILSMLDNMSIKREFV